MSVIPSVDTIVHVGGPVETGRAVEVRLDDWPILRVDVDLAAMRVNDLRATEAFSIVGELYEPLRGVTVDTVVEAPTSLFVSSDTLAVSIELDPEQPTRAGVRALQTDRTVRTTLGTVVDCDVRYRQVTAAEAARNDCQRRR